MTVDKSTVYKELVSAVDALGLKTVSMKSMRKHPQLLDQIMQATSFLPDDAILAERLYCLRNSIFERKRCPVCKTGFLKFNGHTLKYHETGCCPSCSKRNPDVQKKTQQTCLKTYGVASHNQAEEVKLKKEQRCFEHYGAANPSQVPEVKERKRKTSLKNFGYESALASPEKRELGKKTCLERYGVENASQSSEINKKKRRKYFFDGNFFDSSDELALYVYLKGNNIEFEFQPCKTFIYFHGELRYIYYPDFYIINENTYVEVKGDHFFREDGTMFCPYRNHDWTDEKYADVCAKYEAKHQCMLNNGVKILKSSSREIATAKEFVKYTYGASFFEECRREDGE